MYDYSNEPRRVIFMIDNKSFYASVEGRTARTESFKSNFGSDVRNRQY